MTSDLTNEQVDDVVAGFDAMPHLQAVSEAYQALSGDEKWFLTLAVDAVEAYLGDEVGVTKQAMVAAIISRRLREEGVRLLVVPTDEDIDGE